MYLETLTLLQFKNYREANLTFVPGINCFTGNNGTGKTNILDAIYYLSFCKGFCNPTDTQNILFETDFFLVRGKYHTSHQHDELYCSLRKGQKKVFKRNKKEYERLADHIGHYPLVLIYPGDSQLVLGGSEERRKFVDGVISQYNKEYLHRLLSYNKALLQRNTLLKSFAEKRYFDPASLEIWEAQLIHHGQFIHKARHDFFTQFNEVFRHKHKLLSAGGEQIDIAYESQLNHTSPEVLLQESRPKDRAVQHTTTGIHKDNLVFFLEKMPLKKFGSQGQQKTFVIALKLAQFEFIKAVKGFEPLLLFDDIFDKLDPTRVEQLLAMVQQNGFGQVFITDTHAQRLHDILEKLSATARVFQVENGSIVNSYDIGKAT